MCLLRVIVGLVYLGANAAVAGDPMPSLHLKRPAKLLCGYYGYWLGRDSITDTIRTVLDPMATARFNACDFKIQPTDFDLSDADQLRRLRDLAQAARKRDMVLLTYVYPHPHHGRRDPKRDTGLPAFVRADGEQVEDRFSLIHWETWRRLFDNAFQLARVSRSWASPPFGSIWRRSITSASPTTGPPGAASRRACLSIQRLPRRNVYQSSRDGSFARHTKSGSSDSSR
jgi:hypothetical protein